MAEFVVSAADRKVLEGWLRMPTLNQAMGLRARIVLSSAGGTTVRGVALGLGVSPNTVAACRARYRKGGVEGLRSRPRSGRPRQITPIKERAVISATLRRPKAAHPLERAPFG